MVNYMDALNSSNQIRVIMLAFDTTCVKLYSCGDVQGVQLIVHKFYIFHQFYLLRAIVISKLP